MTYNAPTEEFRFLMRHIVSLDEVAGTQRYSDAGPELVDAVLSEAGRLTEEVIAPLNRAGDLSPAVLENGVVRTSPGFAGGYRAIAEGGWVGASASSEHGGMGLPMMVNVAVNEMMSSACLALQLCPMLSQGQIEALEHHASDALKDLYLPKLISGEWTGTMNLTEPQAGSDVGALRTRAEPHEDGTYRITGQKIYITWGDHDVAENVCHLVLARLPDGVPGPKGISLFMVPKRLPDDNGNPGVANSLRPVSLEHKLGLHGSPTAVMEFDAATGWLVGSPHKGMAAMFTMMNNARLGVGVQGIGVAEAAYQAALAYALDRKQGRVGGSGTIVEHADVRRMLLTMKADIFAARSIALACGKAIDMAAATGEADWNARAAFLTPIAKAFGTDIGCEAAHQCVQVHGGMGFIEETGVAQFSRDVRVTPIYEGTNGIQAMDLVGRKLMDGGEAAIRLIEDVQQNAEKARTSDSTRAREVWNAAEALRDGTEWMTAQEDPQDRFAGAAPYLRACARVLGADAHLRALNATGPDSTRAKLARFYIDRHLPEVTGLLAQARNGAGTLFALSLDELASR